MAKEKMKDSPLVNARRCIDLILEAYNVSDALIIIDNYDECQGEIFGDEIRIAKNVKIGMEHNNLLHKRIEKMINLLTL